MQETEQRIRHSITVEVEGKPFVGTYTRRGRVLSVSSEFGDGPIDAGSGSDEVWAKVKLSELVNQWLRSPEGIRRREQEK